MSALLAIAACVAVAQPDAPLPVDQAIRTFQLPPDFRIECVASEPDVIDPVAIAFDDRGRLFVVEMRDYPTGPTAKHPSRGTIALLTDDDGDGRYQRRSTFAADLDFPNGLMPYRDGLLVTCAPDVLYLADTDDDGVADLRRVVFTGFSTGNTQLRVNHPTWGLDNWIYLANGLRGGTVTMPERADDPPIPIPRMDFRFRFDLTRYEATAGFAQFGLTFDDFGQRFVCSNRNPIKHVVLQERHLQRNPTFAFSQTETDLPESGIPAPVFPIGQAKTTALSHAGTFTAACGVTIYRGHRFPEPYRGNAFVCEPTGYLVQRMVLEPDGPTFVARRGRPGVEFLATTDTWCRPVNLANGPDGALYVVDMVRKTIEHPEFLAENVRAVTDFESGKDHGRIWRVVPIESAPEPIRWPATLDTHQRVRMLAHPNAWQRTTAQRLLIENDAKQAIPELRKMLRESDSAQGRLHALYTVEGLSTLDKSDITTALTDDHPALRTHGLRLAEPMLAEHADLFDHTLQRAHDNDARVRFETALVLGNIQDPRVINALSHIIQIDTQYLWSRTAVFSALANRADALFHHLVVNPANFTEIDSDGSAEFLYQLALQMARQSSPDQPAQALSAILNRKKPIADSHTLALVTGLGDGRNARDKKSLTELAKDEPKLNEWFDRAVRIAGDADRSIDERTAAMQLLAHADYDRAGDRLLTLVAPHHSTAVQRAAVAALGKIDDPRVAPSLVARERWRTYSPAVRGEVLANLFRSTDRIRILLDAIAAAHIDPSAVDPARRDRLRRHRDPDIRDRAVALFTEPDNADRKKVFEDYRSVLDLHANADHGKQLFDQHCAVCHRLQDRGTPVGPDLAGIRTQSKETLLLHILIPNHSVEPAYTNYVVLTSDGRTLTGLIASETETSITLRRAEGIEETLLRTEIDELSATSLSLMPADLERTLSRQDLADLIEYLKDGAE